MKISDMFDLYLVRNCSLGRMEMFSKIDSSGLHWLYADDCVYIPIGKFERGWTRKNYPDLNYRIGKSNVKERT